MRYCIERVGASLWHLALREKENNDMRAEYDFSGGARGKHYRAMQSGYTVTVRQTDGSTVIREVLPKEGVIILDPDVQEYFPDSESVNEALRGLIRLIPAEQVTAEQKESRRASKRAVGE